MTHELEKIKAYILEQTECMAENSKIELAGRPGMVGKRGSRKPQFRQPGRRRL